ncbi:MAG: UvrD-helicase domain-containing protein [Dehalococcoidales bacterium]|jgi:DNA helicase-2/ATP-dependent DNA helicase PcrA|nr:UvrD-helicase domain-containing protein [Dehalococcoidales bacterium]
MDILAKLNLAQREAVEQVHGPVLILAGPGSGKTRVITHRVAYLIKICGVSPRHIMAVTFTNKAAREMKNRLFGGSERDRTTPLLTWSMRDQITLGTFHAICARILRRDGRAIGVDPDFVIYDAEDQLKLVKRAIQNVNLDPKQYAPSLVRSRISAAKSQLLTPKNYIEQSISYLDKVVSWVYERYQQLLIENNALDFDDLLMKVVELFRSHPEILAKYQERYRHIMVDEFQDTNLTQYELVRQLSGKYRNICVVGDPDQSIYSWRFADMRNILNFEKDYLDTKVVLLEQNYRSTKRILETASSIISANGEHNPRKLWTDNEPGALTTIVETYNEQEEAQFVISELSRLVEQNKAHLSDCAVMYRTNAQSRALEEIFIRKDTPYKLVAGTRFYERREVKDIIAYLRIIQNPSDSVSLLRIINVPPRAIGKCSISKLSDWAESRKISLYEALRLIALSNGNQSESPKLPFNHRTTVLLAGFFDLLAGIITKSAEFNMAKLFNLVVKSLGYKEYILKETDGEERWDNILELGSVASKYDDLKPREGLTAFLEGVALVSDLDGLDESIGAVTLITLHQAKGLEFPVVFIVGMEEGILPHFRSFDIPEQMKEERRLCYVGITRAKERVYLVHAFRRRLIGLSTANSPSRFLEDIPRHLISGTEVQWGEVRQPIGETYPLASDPTSVTIIPELSPGNRVRHNQFGEGLVISCQSVTDDNEVLVAFRKVGLKKLLLSFARLEKVE